MHLLLQASLRHFYPARLSAALGIHRRVLTSVQSAATRCYAYHNLQRSTMIGGFICANLAGESDLILMCVLLDVVFGGYHGEIQACDFRMIKTPKVSGMSVRKLRRMVAHFVGLRTGSGSGTRALSEGSGSLWWDPNAGRRGGGDVG